MPTKITHVLAVGLIFTLLQGCGEVYAPKTGVEVSSLEAKAPEAEGEARQNHEDGTKETSVLANKEPSQEPSEEVISHEDRDIDSDSHSNATEVAAVSTVDSDAKADGVSEGEVVASEQTPEETSTVGRDGGEGEEEFDDDPYGLLGGESSGEDDFQDDPFGLLGDDEGNEQESDDHAAKQENKLIIDPLEGLNKALFAFGRAVDYAILGPYTTILYAMLPTFVIDRIVDVTAILNMPSSSVQLLLQGQPKLAAHRFGRFIGSVVGGKGIVDAEFSRGYKTEDFGQTIATKGVGEGFYVSGPYGLPVTFRDAVPFGVQTLINDNLWFIHQDPLRYAAFLTGWGAIYSYIGYALLAVERGYSASAVDYINSSLDPYEAYKQVAVKRRRYLVDEQSGEFISKRASTLEAQTSQEPEESQESTSNSSEGSLEKPSGESSVGASGESGTSGTSKKPVEPVEPVEPSAMGSSAKEVVSFDHAAYNRASNYSGSRSYYRRQLSSRMQEEAEAWQAGSLLQDSQS